MPERLSIATADGTMPVWREGSGPFGLIVFMDVFGIRPELCRMCAKLAAAGFTTFLPDLFYRAGEVAFPTDEPPPPEARRLNDETTWQMSVADIDAFLAAVEAPRLFATAGYCMGARHALAAAARHPQRIRSCAMLHGGRLVTDDEASPHRLIAELAGPAYVAFAAEDPTCPPEHQAIVRRSLEASPLPHRIDAFAAHHGFMFPERDVYDPAVAKQATAAMLSLFKTTLTEACAP